MGKFDWYGFGTFEITPSRFEDYVSHLKSKKQYLGILKRGILVHIFAKLIRK